MKIRITGTREEAPAAVRAVAMVSVVREVSEFYPNRGTSSLGRVYPDADAPAAADGSLPTGAVP